MTNPQSAEDDYVRLGEDVFDAGITINRAIHVPTMLAMPIDRLPQWVDDLLQDGELDHLAPLLGLPDGVTLSEAREEDELGSVLLRTRGWVIEATSPMYGPWSTGKHRSRRVYMHLTVSRWFYADTYEDAVREAIGWVESDPAELLYEPNDREGEQ